MTAEAYERLIADGIKGLPPETLAEIADFVFFVRKRLLRPEAFEEEQQALLHGSLRELSRDQAAHLEKEFEGHEQSYPRE